MNPKGQKWISLNLNKIQAQKYIKFLKGNQMENGGQTNVLWRRTAVRLYRYRSALSLSPIAV